MCGNIYEVIKNGDTLNLFDDYTNISTARAKEVAANQWNNNNRKKQSSYIMGMAMLDSQEDNFCA